MQRAWQFCGLIILCPYQIKRFDLATMYVGPPAGLYRLCRASFKDHIARAKILRLLLERLKYLCGFDCYLDHRLSVSMAVYPYPISDVD